MNTVYFKGNYRFVPEGGSDVLSYQGAQRLYYGGLGIATGESTQFGDLNDSQIDE